MLIFAATVLLAVLPALVAVRAPRALAPRLGAVLCAGLLMPAAYVAMVELMGRPKPVWLDWLGGPAHAGGDAEVLAEQMREGEAIYLWLRLPGAAEPVAYRLPWDEQAARALHEARRQTEKSGVAVRMRREGRESTEESEPLFYPEPQRALPPKLAETGSRGHRAP